MSLADPDKKPEVVVIRVREPLANEARPPLHSLIKKLEKLKEMWEEDRDWLIEINKKKPCKNTQRALILASEKVIAIERLMCHIKEV